MMPTQAEIVNALELATALLHERTLQYKKGDRDGDVMRNDVIILRAHRDALEKQAAFVEAAMKAYHWHLHPPNGDSMNELLAADAADKLAHILYRALAEPEGEK
jgi:hypothetical protein